MTPAGLPCKPSSRPVWPLVVLALIAILLTRCEEQPELDLVAPGQVTDLDVIRVTCTSLALRWTATGDDGTCGRAASYDIRYSTGGLDETTWKAASQVEGEPSPSQPGAPDSVVIVGLSAGTVYRVGLKVADEGCNFSELSNVVATTTVPEELWLRVPWVSDGLDADARWTNSNCSLSATWGPAPGAERYEYAIATVPGAPDVVPWTLAGSALQMTHPGLSLTHGVTYHVGVRASAGTECGLAAFSNGITADLVPPESRVRELPPEVDSLSFQVTWSGTDSLSGIAAYSVRYKDGVAGAWRDWLVETPDTTASFTGENGHTYCFASAALDSARNTEEYPADSDAQTRINLVDVPVVAWVHDGLGADEDWTNATDHLSANWSRAAGVDGYECALGRTPGGVSVVGWTSPGTETCFTFADLSLVEESTYFISVRTVVGSFRSLVTASDGITIDVSPPSSSVNPLPSSLIGLGVSVSWQGSDDISPVRAFDVQVKNADAGGWEDWLVGTALRSGRYYGSSGRKYFRCRALDTAGNCEEYPYEADAWIDFMFVVPSPGWVKDGLGGDLRWTDQASQLSANWQEVSEIEGYEYAFGTSRSGPYDVCDWTSSGGETHVTRTGLALTHGATYYAAVRTCFGTARSSVTASNGITVDIVPPESHVLALPDTVEGTYFRVNWAGADDLSGIASYEIHFRDGWTGNWQTWGPVTPATTRVFYHGAAGHTYCFRSCARDSAGNREPCSDQPDAFTYLKGIPHPPPTNPKFALHLASHGANNCNKKPVITGVQDLVRYWSSFTDMDAFMVIFNYDSLFVYEYSLDWPGEWGSCSTEICGGAGIVNLVNPGDPGVAIFMTDGCKTGAVNPFLVVAYHYFLPASPGQIRIRANRATNSIGIVDCRSGTQPTYYFADSIFCAGVLVDPYEGPLFGAVSTSPWENLKALFK
jgi:hypothetical protein